MLINGPRWVNNFGNVTTKVTFTSIYSKSKPITIVLQVFSLQTEFFHVPFKEMLREGVVGRCGKPS